MGTYSSLLTTPVKALDTCGFRTPHPRYRPRRTKSDPGKNVSRPALRVDVSRAGAACDPGALTCYNIDRGVHLRISSMIVHNARIVIHAILLISASFKGCDILLSYGQRHLFYYPCDDVH